MLEPQGIEYTFSQETIDSLSDLAETLQRIHNRLIAEGYIIKDGQIIKPE